MSSNMTWQISFVIEFQQIISFHAASNSSKTNDTRYQERPIIKFLTCYISLGLMAENIATRIILLLPDEVEYICLSFGKIPANL